MKLQVTITPGKPAKPALQPGDMFVTTNAYNPGQYLVLKDRHENGCGTYVVRLNAADGPRHSKYSSGDWDACPDRWDLLPPGTAMSMKAVVS
jgi:hypothetical protein